MHEKVLPKGAIKLLQKLVDHTPNMFEGWTLAGGTGLALQLGHRRSDDLDFFRTDSFPTQDLHKLFKSFDYETLQEDATTLTVIVNRIKLSFFSVSDPFIYKAKLYIYFSVADILDIALMKLVAISGRGSRKDFVDLYSIVRRGHNLQDLINLIPKKYNKGRANSYHILKSLIYFGDAEKEPLPAMLEPFNWEECKNFFIRQAHVIVLPR